MAECRHDPVVLHDHILHDRVTAPGEVVRELRIEAAHRIEAIEQVHPLA